MFEKLELKKAFDNKLINEEQYKEELFALATTKKERKPKRYYEGLKDDEFRKLLEEYNIDKQKIILLLAYGSGLRIQEILNLQPDDINFKDKTIKVRQGKFSKDRTTILPKYFKENYIKLIPFGYSKVGIQKMFFKKSMKIGINRIIATYKLKTGKTRNIYKYHFHCLRHSFAINLLKAGTPINYVQKLLGHSNIASTSVYTEISSSDAINFLLSKNY